MKKQTILTVVTAFCALFLSACASGPMYRDAKATLKPQPKKALVLTYWDSGIVGATAHYSVSANDQVVANSLGRGAFASHDAAPGPLVISTKRKFDALAAAGIMSSGGTSLGLAGYDMLHTQKHPVVNVVAGKTYFMRVSNGFVTVKVAEVPAEKAEMQIALCRWVNPHAPSGLSGGVATKQTVKPKAKRRR